MEDRIKPLKIEISGGDRLTNNLVFGLVQDTLDSVGFKCVEVIHPDGDAAADLEGTESLLNLLTNQYPRLFWQPVIVKQSTKNMSEVAHNGIDVIFTALVENVVRGWPDQVEQPGFDEIAIGEKDKADAALGELKDTVRKMENVKVAKV